jgi:hypothetical protein
MERQLPAGLSEVQRRALSEFFAGHISAGQLTQRLGIDAPPPARDSSSARQSRVQEADLEVRRERPARTATARRRPLALRRAVEGLLRLAPRRSQI